MAARQAVDVFKQQLGAAVQSAMAEYARQADHGQRLAGDVQLIALRQAFQFHGLRRLFDRHLPQLTMACAVQLARLAEGVQQLRRPLDAAALFAHQVQLAALQAGGQGIEQITGQLA